MAEDALEMGLVDRSGRPPGVRTIVINPMNCRDRWQLSRRRCQTRPGSVPRSADSSVVAARPGPEKGSCSVARLDVYLRRRCRAPRRRSQSHLKVRNSRIRLNIPLPSFGVSLGDLSRLTSV